MKNSNVIDMMAKMTIPQQAKAIQKFDAIVRSQLVLIMQRGIPAEILIQMIKEIQKDSAFKKAGNE